ncbi:V(D)J recombination-activating protein 1-like [Ptychodera flava]|uniref:V(D)J recombination-activating protein 1-like n=1 Tax=Ptychodera flava TaxID=63121 RepID=UPI00396A9D26
MSPQECLALRVNTFTSCNQYKKIYSATNELSGVKIFQPLINVVKAEESFLPGSVKFYFNPSLKTVSPIWQGTEHVDALSGLSRDIPLLESPDVYGARYRYDKAVAMALKDIDNEISEGLSKLEGVDTNQLVLTATVKDGSDGLGDVKEVRSQGLVVPNKALRFSFVILEVTVNVDGKIITVFEEDAPNSELCTRPLLVALADENDRKGLCMTHIPIMIEREEIEKSTLFVEIEEGKQRIYKVVFKGTMYDEKLQRSGEGMLAAGSSWFCTLCEKGRLDPISSVLPITRTHENNMALYSKYVENANHMKQADLVKEVKGIVRKPFIMSEPCVDATHAEIHWGEKNYDMYVREISGIMCWGKPSNDDDAKKVKSTKRMLDTELQLQCGLKREHGFMVDGNYARDLVKSETVDVVCSLIQSEARKSVVREYVSYYRELRSIYRKHNADLDDAVKFKTIAANFYKLLHEKFPYLHPLSNYQHKVLDHIPQLIEQYGSVGKFASEGNEKGNKLFRRFRKFNARKSQIHEMPDILKFHWLYTMKSLQTMVNWEKTRSLVCSKCGCAGHNQRTCIT